MSMGKSEIEYNSDNPLKVIELFAGYGSQAIALQRLKETYPPFDYKVLAIAEIEDAALKAYQAIHGHCPNLGDVSKIRWGEHTELQDVDLVTYSFPCQDISNAGKQSGFAKGSGTRSGLLWECEKCFRELQPRYLLMENVKALIQKKFMPMFNEWIALLESLGYKSYWQVINSKDQGVPQNRERVFMMSCLDDDFTYNFPSPIPLTKCVEDIMVPLSEVPEDAWIDPERVTSKVVRDILDQPNVYEELLWRYHVEEASRRLFGRSDFDFMMQHYDELSRYATETLGAVCPD